MPHASPLGHLPRPAPWHPPVYPGDTPLRLHWTSSLGPGCAVNVGALTLSTHLGAHADAPLHYDPQGAAVGALALEPFLGPCRVVHARGNAALVQVADLAHALGDPLPPRLLVRTRVHPAPAHWDANFRALAPALLEHLADRGLLLVGVDTPSVDPADSTDLPSHQVLRQRDLRVLENLVLDEVPEGDYELIALPLKLSTADASPVRAVLRAL
jgi:arylformamidase